MHSENIDNNKVNEPDSFLIRKYYMKDSLSKKRI